MEEEKVRLSIDLGKKDHRLFKLECSKRGLVPKLKMQELIVEWLEDVQDCAKVQALEETRKSATWSNFNELRRRMGWDAL